MRKHRQKLDRTEPVALALQAKDPQVFNTNVHNSLNSRDKKNRIAFFLNSPYYKYL